jgi:hypothetical protein
MYKKIAIVAIFGMFLQLTIAADIFVTDSTLRSPSYLSSTHALPSQNQNQQAVSQPNARDGERGASKESARPEIAERRAEAAKKDPLEKGKNLTNEMGRVAYGSK